MIHETIDVWGHGEGSEGSYRGDMGDGFAPVIDTYVLDGNKRRAAVLICPGGGYGFLSPREAEPIALQFNAAGYHAFVLHYSVAPRRHPLPLLDVSKALCVLRRRAEEYNIHSGRIALCGFSAGAHLAASLGVYWDKPLSLSGAGGVKDLNGQTFTPTGIEPGMNRPDALILCYPVITSGSFAHKGSFENLLGPGAGPETLAEVSLELHVNEKTPPAFIWHTYADEGVPLENSFLFAGALRAAGVPFEYHVYPEGPHGLSLATEETSVDGKEPNPHVSSWMYLCVEWLGEQFED
ncbi:MAG TPA: alpha/beta hydrolase [Rectinemataceae bacterium]|nr:alpha/beta hydrolase [Rectinemataceae bacterium]